MTGVNRSGGLPTSPRGSASPFYKLGSQFGAGALPPISTQHVWEIPFDFDEVQLCMINGYSTTDNISWTFAAAVAPTEVLAQPVPGQSGANQWQPIQGGAATTANFVQITQNGSVVLSPDLYNGPRSQTTPQNFSRITPLDWAKVTPLPRTDGGNANNRLLLVRFQILSGASKCNYFNGPAAADITSYYTNSAGLSSSLTEQAGGGTTIGAGNWTNYGGGTVRDESNASANHIIGPAYILRFRSRQKVLTLMAIGDSTIAAPVVSSSVTDWWVPFVFKVAQNNTDTTRPIMPANMAWSGMTCKDYLFNFQNACADGLVPDVAIMLGWSVNDIANYFSNNLDSSALLPWFMGLIEEFISTCQSYGIEPIVATAWPKPYGAVHQPRADVNAAIRALQLRGIQVLDLDAITGTGPANNRQWVAGGSLYLYSDDSGAGYTHPNELAHQVVAAAVPALLGQVAPISKTDPVQVTALARQNDANAKKSVTLTTATWTNHYRDETVLANATAQNITVTPATASAAIGYRYTVKKTDASANTVTITGAENGTNVVLSSQNSSVTYESDGTNYHVTGKV